MALVGFLQRRTAPICEFVRHPNRRRFDVRDYYQEIADLEAGKFHMAFFTMLRCRTVRQRPRPHVEYDPLREDGPIVVLTTMGMVRRSSGSPRLLDPITNRSNSRALCHARS